MKRYEKPYTRQDLAHSIPSDDHLCQAALRADPAITGRLHMEAMNYPENSPMYDYYENMSWQFQESVDSLLQQWRADRDPAARKDALLSAVQESFVLAQTHGADLRYFRAMEKFVELLKMGYNNERNRHLDDSDYVSEHITRHASNVTLGRPESRDPEGIFGATECYLRVANHTIRALSEQAELGTEQTLFSKAAQQWAKDVGYTRETFDMEALEAIAPHTEALLRDSVKTFAKVLPVPLPIEAAGFIHHTTMDARTGRRLRVLQGDQMTTEPWVRKVLEDLFKQYPKAGMDASSLVEAYDALERRLGPIPPEPEREAGAVALGSRRA